MAGEGSRRRLDRCQALARRHPRRPRCWHPRPPAARSCWKMVSRSSAMTFFRSQTIGDAGGPAPFRLGFIEAEKPGTPAIGKAQAIEGRPAGPARSRSESPAPTLRADAGHPAWAQGRRLAESASSASRWEGTRHGQPGSAAWTPWREDKSASRHRCPTRRFLARHRAGRKPDPFLPGRRSPTAPVHTIARRVLVELGGTSAGFLRRR